MTAKMTKPDQMIFTALQGFAGSVAAKMKALAAGQPEDQLRAPLESFLTDVGKAIGIPIVAKGESRLKGRLGRPDYAVLASKLLAGYIELKEPGKGANPEHYKGHDRNQWKRFQAIPNLIYTDGNEWGLFRNGQRVGTLVRLSGDITKSGKSAVKAHDLDALKPLLMDFLSWDPIVPADAKALAELLAPICRMLREEVNDALKDSKSLLVQLAEEWRNLLFPDADDDRFADAYAQTVTFALLLARSEGAKTIDEDLHDTIHKLAADHALLSRALQFLTDPAVRDEIAPSLRLLQRVIDRVPIDAMKGNGKTDPWLYFYEDFLAAYDPKLRKDAGAYYTPVEVVHAQVRLIDHLLVNKLNRPMGFADSGVITLDPAVGTGTYLLGVIDHAIQRVSSEHGEGAVPGHATRLGQNIFGFEIMVGPYAVAELRVSRDLLDRKASLPKGGPGVYLTDTLESPHSKPPTTAGLFYKPLADQHKKALEVKDAKPVLVCLGNPPYDRHGAADAMDPSNLVRTGGWVRYGDPLEEGTVKAKRGKKRSSRRLSPEETLRRRQQRSILHKAFIQPALDAGHGGDVKNLYNLYVYFWRWALWKVFEHTSSVGPGVASFISASSYMDGDAFVGMREYMRRLCDDIWIIDLGGEGRGTRQSENVFAIQTPVAIAVAVCYGEVNKDKPAKVHITRVEGTRDQKLATLDAVTDFADLIWEECLDGWQAPFRPAVTGAYFDWPMLTDLLPWQHSGVQLKRTWPIGPDTETLKRRWRALLESKNRAEAFRESGDRIIRKSYKPILPTQTRAKPIADLSSKSPDPDIHRYAHRSFDRWWIIADGRVMSRPRPELWAAHGDHQAYLTTLLNHPLGSGPAVTACAAIPDLHHFRGSYGAREAIPLYRDTDATHANIAPDLLDLLKQTYGRKVSPEDFLAYIFAILGQPVFTERFFEEIATLDKEGRRQLRVPLTKDANLFDEVAEIGRRLLWLHTYGQRFTGQGRRKGTVPRGKAKCTKAVSDKPTDYPDDFDYNEQHRRLTVGTGTFEPVERDVYEFEVSGLQVLQSWLGYRMQSGKGKKSSPLDDIRPERWTAQFTTELLELLWVLEATLALYPEQAKLLGHVMDGAVFHAGELPDVPEVARRGPRESEGRHLWT